MQRGDVLDGRFTIEESAGAGGMGQVFRGRPQILNGSQVHAMFLAYLRLAQGRAAEAAEIAERLCSEWRASGMLHVARMALILLVRAEAFHALGDRDAAQSAIREARDDLLGLAAKIPDLEVRRGFLENFS